MVTDTQPIDYRTNDGGHQNDPRIAPINPKFIEMGLKYLFCIPGVYNTSTMEFHQSNLYRMINWHTSRYRFAETSAINLTVHSTRVNNDSEWLAHKDNRTHFTLTNLPALVQKNNTSALMWAGSLIAFHSQQHK